MYKDPNVSFPGGFPIGVSCLLNMIFLSTCCVIELISIVTKRVVWFTFPVNGRRKYGRGGKGFLSRL